jgi:hypothetical protein
LSSDVFKSVTSFSIVEVLVYRLEILVFAVLTSVINVLVLVVKLETFPDKIPILSAVSLICSSSSLISFVMLFVFSAINELTYPKLTPSVSLVPLATFSIF